MPPPFYGARPMLQQYREQERELAKPPEGPTIEERIATALVVPGLMGYQVLSGAIGYLKRFPEMLPRVMRDPLNPQSQKDITELTVDIGTRAGLSTRTAGMSTLGIFAGGRAKVKPPSISSAAFKMPDGTIYKGASHPSIAMEQIEKGTVKSHKEFYNAEPGFITDKDKFLTRYEASKGFGWRQNPYGKHWEFEIDDSKMKWNTNVWDEATLGGGKDVKLGRLIDHPELFDAYPELKDITVRHTPGKGGGEWIVGKRRIRIGAEMGPRKTLIHEIQHTVQEIEDWPRGGSPTDIMTQQNPLFKAAREKAIYSELKRLKEIRGIPDLPTTIEFMEKEGLRELPFNEVKKMWRKKYGELIKQHKKLNKAVLHNADLIAYHNLVGEIQAEEAAKRMGMTAEERLRSAPYKGAIPPEQAIIRYGQGIGYQKRYNVLASKYGEI